MMPHDVEIINPPKITFSNVCQEPAVDDCTSKSRTRGRGLCPGGNYCALWRGSRLSRGIVGALLVLDVIITADSLRILFEVEVSSCHVLAIAVTDPETS